MTEQWPKVSVTIPTRDRIDFLTRAVAAVEAQDYPGEIEIIVVVDGGEPVALPATSADREVVVLTNTRTPGAAGNRNTGILAGTGELVAFCDDDDEWLPQKLRAQVAALTDHPGTQMVTSGIELFEGPNQSFRLPPAELLTFHQLLRSRTAELHLSTVVARRDAVVDGWGLFDEDIPGSYGEDYDWALRAARVAPIRAVAQPLVRIYRHEQSYFTTRWDVIAEAIDYLIAKHPEFQDDSRGLARLCGRAAFAHAAAGRRRVAARWALRALRLDARERRAYLALAVGSRLVAPDTVMRAAARGGRGI